MIEVEGLTKRYGDRTAVDGVSFQVHPGTVTGFLGPNGAGKSTTMRMIAGLDRPTAGRVRVNGRDYRHTPAPMAELGVLLEAKAIHPGRSARDHLLALAQTAGLGKARVDEVIEQVGLAGVARRRVGGFSLGMGQRLGIAVALLGQPRTIMLDEPVNGLDPEGVRWVRTLLRSLAAQGCTVFVSSHLLGEVAETADRLVVIGKGQVIADSTVEEFVDQMVSDTVVVRTPEAGRLRALLGGPGVTITADSADTLHVRGLLTDDIGHAAWQANIPVLELSVSRGSLEEAFMQATNDSTEFVSTVQEAVR
ncbi:MAG TPA: ABC transporter ATP-binding protein [Trebonia sp.]|jgi:ABC-2 type transport system ATP-binding protein